MDAILSSFCFIDSNMDKNNTFFHRMPPVCFRTTRNQFLPDYSILFLCDSFYVDELAMERIEGNQHFKRHAEMLDALEASGRLKICNFSQEVAPHREVIKTSVKEDMRAITTWKNTFSEVVSVWNKFRDTVEANLEPRWVAEQEMYEWGRKEALRSERQLLQGLASGMYQGLDDTLIERLSRWKQKLSPYDRLAARQVVSGYLEHVSATLCLSDILGASIHDWADIGPIYKRKFSTTIRVRGQDALAHQEQVQKLFSVMFPFFEPKDASTLGNALNDKRIESLRSLVSDAVKGKVTFDPEFANRTLWEVLKTEQSIQATRDVVGWLTKPLSFVPWAGSVLDTVAEKVVGSIIAHRQRHQKEWFYLLSEIDVGGSG